MIGGLFGLTDFPHVRFTNIASLCPICGPEVRMYLSFPSVALRCFVLGYGVQSVDAQYFNTTNTKSRADEDIVHDLQSKVHVFKGVVIYPCFDISSGKK